MRHQIRVYTLKKRDLLILLCLFLGIILFNAIRVSIMHPNNVSASSADIQHREKIITRVLVKKDDTLWEYACKYYSSEYETINELVLEIKRTNGISDNRIKEGSYLLIPHYVTIETTFDSHLS